MSEQGTTHTLELVPFGTSHYGSTQVVYYGLSRGKLTDPSHMRAMYQPNTGTAFLAPASVSGGVRVGWPVRIVHGDILTLDGHPFRVWCPPDWVLEPGLRCIESTATPTTTKGQTA